VPNIRTFDTPQLGLQPTEIGIEATAAAARRGGTFYNQAAAALTARGQHIASATKDAGDLAINYIEHREISNGAAKLAQIEDGYTGAWQKFASNPNLDWNDPTIVQQFRAQMEPGLQQFKDSFITEGGKQWAEGRVDRFREHMFTKTAADQSTLSAAAIALNMEQTVNSATSRVYKDPSVKTLDDAIAGLHDSINATVDSSPTLDVSARVQAKASLFKQEEKLVNSAIMGAIANTGGDWKTIAENPKYARYVDMPAMRRYEREQQFYNRLDASEKRNARIQADYESRRDFNTRVNEIEAATIPQNVGDRPTLPPDYWNKLRELSKHPGAGLEPGRLRTMVQQGEILTERLNKPEPLGRVSHDTTMQLLKQIRSTDDTRLVSIDPIYDAYQAGRLNNADFNFLRNEYSALRSPQGLALDKDRDNFFKKFAPVIDGDYKFQMQQHSVLGTQQMYAFEMAARAQEEDLRKQGKDPHLVYDPRSEQFFGRPENLAKYRVSAQQAQQYEKMMKDIDAAEAAAPRPNVNFTGPGKDITGVQIIDIPPGMTNEEIKRLYPPGTKIRLPDKRIGTVPGKQ
jgi:hypothetical protein